MVKLINNESTAGLNINQTLLHLNGQKFLKSDKNKYWSGNKATETLNMTDQSVNWWDHMWEQFGGLSENWKYMKP